MPTDESYLDNLLKGLTSDAGKKEDDRLSTYRRRRDGEIKDSYDRQEIPGFLNDYIEEDKKLQFHVVPDQEEIDPGFEDIEDLEDTDEFDDTDESDEFAGEQGYFDEEEDRDDDDFGQDADDTIENYDIFEDDIDDSLIDEMIASELSEDEDFGKPFGVSESQKDYREPKTLPEREKMFPDPEPLVYPDRKRDEEDNPVKAEQPEEPEEADALADIFGNMSADTAEDNSNVTMISNGDEVSLIDTDALDSLFDAEDSDSAPDNSNVTIEDSAPEETTEAVDEWVIDNSVEEIPPEEEPNVEIVTSEDSEEELADIFSGGSEASEPQSLNDIEGLEGLSNEDINSLDGLFSELEEETEENRAKKEEKKEKIPFLLKIFGNVPIPPDKIKPEPTEEELAAKKAEDAEKKKAKKEEKKKAADDKKKAAADAKAAKARQTAEEKAAAKAKKKEQMEKLLLEDVGNTQKLNLAGIIVVFAMFAAVAALIISSINTANYNASIKEAQTKFDQALEKKDPDLYTEAYHQLVGLEIKDKDKILEDKVYTVNFVNIEITSFNSHYAMGDKVTALRDLLNGVMTYNFYIDHAYELEIEDHLLYLRSILIGLLESEYGIDEEEAVIVIHNYDDLEKKQGERAAKVYITMYIYEKVAEVNSKK